MEGKFESKIGSETEKSRIENVVKHLEEAARDKGTYEAVKFKPRYKDNELVSDAGLCPNEHIATNEGAITPDDHWIVTNVCSTDRLRSSNFISDYGTVDDFRKAFGEKFQGAFKEEPLDPSGMEAKRFMESFEK